ncbi:hypothetical protein M8818_003441 [Zalaria obscura]|uniref:Uncharacterized protein n=1 Tax=Zalaria obscura TaxID=2024903 RepID=A0ACC3SEP9_9PEZI
MRVARRRREVFGVAAGKEFVGTLGPTWACPAKRFRRSSVHTRYPSSLPQRLSVRARQRRPTTPPSVRIYTVPSSASQPIQILQEQFLTKSSELAPTTITMSADVVASRWRLVEVGRVVLFSAGPYAGRLAAIVEIIDHKRVRRPTRT